MDGAVVLPPPRRGLVQTADWAQTGGGAVGVGPDGGLG
jgi:hypothetical protein